MNIGIIGSGKMGSGLGKIWAKKGHQIIFSFSRDAAKLDELAKSVPNARTGSLREAVEKSEVVLLSVAWSQVTEAMNSAGPFEGKLVIDCTNPLKPDISDLALGCTTSAAEEVAKLAPGAKVVKAFNTAFAEVYHASSRLFGSRLPTMFFCGDDDAAKNIVSRLIVDAGFGPVDAGPLKSARYLEPVAMLMIQLAYGRGMGTNIAIDLIRR
ncbi:MAG TPA: NADPH-dependent F420 reductase [Thermodesulfovibrionales bacterium]|nr:NADPH-dependent F420 reductase [Thermodesulfovibrionales bacterium]